MEFPPCCFHFLSSSNPLIGTLSAQTVLQMPSSALIWCLIIDCGQLVKSSSCFQGPPRPPATRLQYFTFLYTTHGQGNPASLPTFSNSALLCVTVSRTAGVSEVHTVTLGDAEKLIEEKFRSSFPCEENELRKITTRNSSV